MATVVEYERTGQVVARPLCADCGTRFAIYLEQRLFYESKGLHEPRRCPRCRHLRRDCLIEASGTVVSVGAAFLFIEGSDGQRFFAPWAGVAREDRVAMAPGVPVSFRTNPAAEVPEGRRPLAVQVRRPIDAGERHVD